MYDNNEEIKHGTNTENVAELAKSSRGGRKKKNDGDKKTEKIMIYVTPALFSDIQDMAYLNRQPMAGFITGLLESHIKDNQERLQKFRNL